MTHQSKPPDSPERTRRSIASQNLSTADAGGVIVAPLADLAVAVPIDGLVDPFRRSGGERCGVASERDEFGTTVENKSYPTLRCCGEVAPGLTLLRWALFIRARDVPCPFSLETADHDAASGAAALLWVFRVSRRAGGQEGTCDCDG